MLQKSPNMRYGISIALLLYSMRTGKIFLRYFKLYKINKNNTLNGINVTYIYVSCIQNGYVLYCLSKSHLQTFIFKNG